MEESELKPHQQTYLHPSMADRVENCDFVEGDWRTDPDPIHCNTFSNLEEETNDCDVEEVDEGSAERVVSNPISIRNELKEFFMMSGLVKWQFKPNYF